MKRTVVQKREPLHVLLGLAKALPRFRLPEGRYCDVCEEIADHQDPSSLMRHNDGLRERQQAKRASEQRIAQDVLAAMRGASPAPAAAPKERHRPPQRQLRTLDGPTYVTPNDVMQATGCERRTAYRYLADARAGRPGRTTTQEWNEYARHRWGTGDD